MSKTPDKLLNEELELLTNEVMNLKLNCRTEIDLLKLEIETLKRLLSSVVPDFPERFHTIKETVIREVIPE